MTRINARGDDQRKQLAQAEKARYYREWRKRNPGKQAEYNQKYWEKKALERMRREQDRTEPAE